MSTFVIYCDFQSYDKELNTKDNKRTENLTSHVASSHRYRVLCANPKYRKEYVDYLGEGCEKNFLEDIEKEVKKCQELLGTEHTKRKTYKNLKCCHICKGEFEEIPKSKVLDHDHITRKFREVHINCYQHLEHA